MDQEIQRISWSVCNCSTLKVELLTYTLFEVKCPTTIIASITYPSISAP